jgi:hypothetical protein
MPVDIVAYRQLDTKQREIIFRVARSAKKPRKPLDKEPFDQALL